jgi:hypothetical protein
MANVRISALPALSSMTDATVFPVVDSGSTKQVNANVMYNYIFARDQVKVYGNVVPGINNLYTLGTPTQKWANIYVGPDSFFIEDKVTGYNAELTVANSILSVNGVSGLTAGNLQIKDNDLVSLLPSTDINIGQLTASANINLNRRTYIYAPNTISVTQAALNIVGSSSRLEQPRNFTGTMLQVTGQDNVSARVSIDSFGSNAYPLIAGRAARGNVLVPTQIKNNDILLRITSQGYASNAYISSIGRIDIQAAEDFTASNAGTKIAFWSTPIGSRTVTLPMYVDSTGINLSANTNITYSPKIYRANANISIDFTKDSIVYATIGGNALSVNPVNLVQGKTIDLWITQDNNTNWTLTHGLTARSSTIGATTLALKVTGPGSTPLQVVHCKYTCIDGTSANTFVSIIYQ